MTHSGERPAASGLDDPFADDPTYQGSLEPSAVQRGTFDTSTLTWPDASPVRWPIAVRWQPGFTDAPPPETFTVCVDHVQQPPFDPDPFGEAPTASPPHTGGGPMQVVELPPTA